MAQRTRITGKEQYYTPLETADYCFNLMLSKINCSDRTWLEPGGGGRGAFIEAMIKGGIPKRNIVSYDIEPKHPLIEATEDFLKEDISHLSNCITLSNPPFGRNNKLSIPFFNKCAVVSEYIGFIVPKSWRKWSVLNRLDTRFHLIHDEELCIDYINYGQGNRGKLNTIFQIYLRKGIPRKIVKVEDRGYVVKTTPEKADVSLTIFGRGCGTISTSFPRQKNTTKMFLKVSSSEVMNALNTLDYARFYNNVAFVEALSIQEINYLLNEFFGSTG